MRTAKVRMAGAIMAIALVGCASYSTAYDEAYPGQTKRGNWEIVEQRKIDKESYYSQERSEGQARNTEENESYQRRYGSGESYPSRVESDTQYRGGGTTIINNYYYYDYDDYYDYYYTARIRRFHHPIIGCGYWCGYYVDYYYYYYDPFYCGISIYVSYPFYRVWIGYPWWSWWWYPSWVWYVYYYDPFWWTVATYPYPWWRYSYAYWHGYWHGYWDGYWRGYWDGYWNRNTACYYYNRYSGTVSYHYDKPRGSEYTTSSSIWRTRSNTTIAIQHEYPASIHSTPKPFSEINHSISVMTNTPVQGVKPGISGGDIPTAGNVKPIKETITPSQMPLGSLGNTQISAIKGGEHAKPDMQMGSGMNYQNQTLGPASQGTTIKEPQMGSLNQGGGNPPHWGAKPDISVAPSRPSNEGMNVQEGNSYNYEPSGTMQERPNTGGLNQSGGNAPYYINRGEEYNRNDMPGETPSPNYNAPQPGRRYNPQPQYRGPRGYRAPEMNQPNRERWERRAPYQPRQYREESAPQYRPEQPREYNRQYDPQPRQYTPPREYNAPRPERRWDPGRESAPQPRSFHYESPSQPQFAPAQKRGR